MLSVLQVDHTTCFNVLVDDVGAEGVILFEKLEDAKFAMFKSGKYGPANVKDAYSKEQHMQLSIVNGTEVMKGMRPRGATRLQPDVSAALESCRGRLEELTPQYRPMEADLDKIRRRLQANMRELREVSNRLRSHPGDVERLTAEIEELERPPEVAPDQRERINSLEASLPELEAKLAAAHEEVARIQGEKKEFLKQLDPLKQQMRELRAAVQSVDASLQTAVNELDSISKAIDQTLPKLEQFKLAMTKLADKLAACTERHTAQSKVVEEYCVKAQVLSKRPDQPIEHTPDHLIREITTLERVIVEQQRTQQLDSNVVEQYEEAKATITELKEGIDETKYAIEMATDMLKRRATRWVDFRKRIQQRTKALFISYLSQRNFLGDLEFDHKQKTLNVKINPNRADANGEARDTAGLSGGERSYSTVSLLLALWEMMESPFRAMDEFDVFMDSVNRLIAMEMLLNAASQKKHRQHIFLTPQQLQGVQAQDWIKIFRMKAPERNQRTITGMLNGGNEADDNDEP